MLGFQGSSEILESSNPWTHSPNSFGEDLKIVARFYIS
jgi:hypothetical protein